MKRGGKNYKKKSQFPDQDLNILRDIMADAEKTPPERVKQPFNTNQPYQPTSFNEVTKVSEEIRKKTS